jgi:uncharacterized protein
MKVIRAVGAAIAIAAMLAPGGRAQTASAQAPAGKRVLVLTHNTFYNHSNLEAIEDVVPEWGKTAGFTVTSLQGYKQTVSCTTQKPCDPGVVDLSMVTRQYLSQFDGIVASTNGELPLTAEGKQALYDFVARDGKGIVFLHQSVVTLYAWKPWGELLGAYLGSGGTIFDTMNTAKRVAVMKVEDRKHPATRSLPEHWALHDEFYQFAKTTDVSGPTKVRVPMAFSRDKVHVLVSFDSDRTDFTGVQGWEKGGDYPQAWYQTVGKGRTFYSAIGHREDLWRSDQVFRAYITGAIRWVLRLEN